MKVFGVPFVLVRHVKVAILPIVNTTSEAVGKLKLMGANEAMVMAQTGTTSAANRLRPLRLFTLASALTQQIGAGALLAKNETAHSAAEATFMGGNIYYLDNANRTSNAASGASATNLQHCVCFGTPCQSYRASTSKWCALISRKMPPPTVFDVKACL
ncbi:uncharacterized protein Z519_04827 [Cladophialophora bantiana CBS 173.52]|uniref:Uncharacterized protein n=1 Tax=Cladophialophora bantiana (strain ATCC 10958 / CBS 173.52 / CDC B-1940 / NIH 8579) TaxID=1442370 RepID=A0A0D2IDL0_CLAB1|nr:uncharacterized protein Z519_04827 [Cladophialophora bantiana CBS 173.52]KIW94849.1 hypothetical protein Z519_04827 [Cladophialophora bantiana CBS 173.52]